MIALLTHSSVRRPALAALLLLCACAHAPREAAKPLLQINAATQCDALNAVPLAIATFNLASSTFPEHCQIDGKINPRTGVDGKPYAINYRLRLPTQWNGRFYMGGGGGINGVLIDPVAQLKQGFATIGTDSGHDNRIHNDLNAGGIASFGVDPQARIDFAYNAYDQVTRAGKSLTESFYKTPAQYSYFEGCSEGGREALLMAQRYPQHYDGIVSGAPTLHLPLGPMAGIHTTQLFAGLASRAGQKLANGQPAIGQSMSDSDLGIVRQSILSACDALDGATDGIVANLAACTTARVRPALLAKQCTGAKTAACLSADQIQTLEKAYAGATDSKGQQLYSDWPWDPGVNSAAWRSWWLGTDSPTANNAIKLNFVSAIAVLYSSQPKLPFTAADTLPFSLAYNFDTDVAKIYGVSKEGATPLYSASAAQMYFTEATDLSPYQRKGGKLMVYHGGADSAISLNDTLRWYEGVNQKMGNTTQNFARMFVVPGMNHCRGGPATDKFDMLTPVIDWVERGIAPNRLVAEASTPAFFNTNQRSRPLCPHPQISQYKGSGDINDAHNFSCQLPNPARYRELLVDGNVSVDVIVDEISGSKGTTVVLLPSSLRDSEDFDEVAALIAAKGHKVLRPQPRGMGRSSAPQAGMTLHTLAKDVALTIERLGGGQAVVVGHAYGHWTARVTAMNHPHLVRGVVVAGASAKVFPAGTAEALAIGSDPTKPDADRIAALQKVMFAKGSDPKIWLTGWHPEWRAAYRAAGAVPAKDVWFNQASSPILDLQGDQDPWRPASTLNELKDVIGDKVTVQIIRNASHALLPEQPHAVADAITAWIRGLNKTLK